MSHPAASFDLRLVETPVATLPCVVRGPAHGPRLLIVPPLFEEMNRTRRLLADVGRHLASAGIASWLPDLPGTGDSDPPGPAMDWDLWRRSLAALAETLGNPLHVLAVRGGALLADAIAARSYYFLAPVASGERQLRELLRARAAADREQGRATTPDRLADRLLGETVELAGYPISPALASALCAASLVTDNGPTRTAWLVEDRGDRRFDGPPVWRQAEPAGAAPLAVEIAADVAAWIASCGAR